MVRPADERPALASEHLAECVVRQHAAVLPILDEYRVRNRVDDAIEVIARLLHLRFRTFPLGVVAGDAEHQLLPRGPVGRPHEVDRPFVPAPATILETDRLPAGHDLRHSLNRLRHILRQHEIDVGPAEQFLGAIAQELVARRADGCEPALCVHGADHVERVLDHRALSARGFRQRLLHPAPFGDFLPQPGVDARKLGGPLEPAGVDAFEQDRAPPHQHGKDQDVDDHMERYPELAVIQAPVLALQSEPSQARRDEQGGRQQPSRSDAPHPLIPHQ